MVFDFAIDVLACPRGHQLFFGLIAKSRIGNEHAEQHMRTAQNVVCDNVFDLLLAHHVAKISDRPRQTCSKPGLVRTALRCWDGVTKTCHVAIGVIGPHNRPFHAAIASLIIGPFAVAMEHAFDHTAEIFDLRLQIVFQTAWEA